MPEDTNVMSNEEWGTFVKGDALNFMIKYNLQKLVIDDGSGRKGVVRRASDGSYKTSTTVNETL